MLLGAKRGLFQHRQRLGGNAMEYTSKQKGQTPKKMVDYLMSGFSSDDPLPLHACDRSQRPRSAPMAQVRGVDTHNVLETKIPSSLYPVCTEAHSGGPQSPRSVATEAASSCIRTQHRKAYSELQQESPNLGELHREAYFKLRQESPFIGEQHRKGNLNAHHAECLAA